MNKIKLFTIVLALLLALPSVLADEPGRLVVNSELWTDVYSVMQFGALLEKPSHFLVSNRHATLLPNSLPKSEHLWIVSSEDNSFISGYEAFLGSRGFSVEEFEYEDINLELAKQLEAVTDFIVVSPAYGYNAVSVASYAAVSNRYVLFATEDNIDDIVDFLNQRGPTSVLIYGHVDREVGQSLQAFSPEVINNEGDRFLNNIEILKRYQALRGAKQVILTNGEFIEQEIMRGNEPVVFIGTNNVPESIREYIAESDIEVGVLIGNELVGTATFIRRQIGISVFVKFAQGARQPQGRISQVEALDMFYLPTYTLNLELDSLRYNRATKQLEVTLQNTEDQALYLLGTYTLRDQDGNSITVGDDEPSFMDGNEVKTFVFDDIELSEGSISADVFIVYGESPGSLERELRLTIDVESVTVLDGCQITLDESFINVRKKQFEVVVSNPSEETCYVDVELVDLVIAGAKNTYSSQEVETVKAGSSQSIKVQVPEFEEEDLEDNEQVRIKAYYGQRKNALIKVVEGKMLLLVRKGDYVFYTLIVIIIILLVLIYLRRRNRDDRPPAHPGRPHHPAPPSHPAHRPVHHQTHAARPAGHPTHHASHQQPARPAHHPAAPRPPTQGHPPQR